MDGQQYKWSVRYHWWSGSETRGRRWSRRLENVRLVVERMEQLSRAIEPVVTNEKKVGKWWRNWILEKLETVVIGTMK